jgi:hypothetical protein
VDRVAGGRDVTLVTAAAAVAAGLVHLVVLPVHLRESLLYGAFFAATAAAQIGWAALVLVRPSRRLLTVGAAANAAVVLLWLLTRTVGIPLGPSAGEVESVSGLDLLATAAELAVVAGAVYGLARGRFPSRRRLWALARHGALVPLMAAVALTVGTTAYLAPPS